ncbi:MAG TPA: glycosyltransferase [Terriglobia bacterium]|nr:glycosyltransferase [Terriglobia bacterium]
MRVALVHHWLVTMRGGERVLEALAEMFPSADIFTLVCDRKMLPSSLSRLRIQTSLLQRLPRSTRWYPYYLPLFPFATRQLDLTGYDLVVSSDAAVIKGIRIDDGATHICYCHSPMRCLWSGYEVYRQAAHPVVRFALSAVRDHLCRWDYEAAQGVDFFVANSENVKARIERFYGRASVVIHPPVDTRHFVIDSRQEQRDDFFLVVSQLVAYKRIDLVIDAFTRCKRPLLIIGDGPERQKLERRAGKYIHFAGSLPQRKVIEAMQRCKAFVFAGEEDFGIVMAEAQACGTPVVALGKGGALEIVEDNLSGILFNEESVDSLMEALDRFDRASFDPRPVRASAMRFTRQRFLDELSTLIHRCALDEESDSSVPRRTPDGEFAERA